LEQIIPVEEPESKNAPKIFEFLEEMKKFNLTPNEDVYRAAFHSLSYPRFQKRPFLQMIDQMLIDEWDPLQAYNLALEVHHDENINEMIYARGVRLKHFRLRGKRVLNVGKVSFRMAKLALMHNLKQILKKKAPLKEIKIITPHKSEFVRAFKLWDPPLRFQESEELLTIPLRNLEDWFNAGGDELLGLRGAKIVSNEVEFPKIHEASTS